MNGEDDGIKKEEPEEQKKDDTLDIKSMKCSKCGGDIVKTHRVEGDDEDEEYIPIARCLNCGAEFDQYSQEYYEYYSDLFVQDKDNSLFALGIKGVINEIEYEVIGRIRYQDEEEYEVETWDEWLAISADGVYHYFVEEGGKIQSHAEYIPESIDLESDPYNIEFEGKKISKDDKGYTARIVYAEGELPWQPEIGEPITMYDFKKDGNHFTIEKSENEVSITKGEIISHKVIIDAFGREEFKEPYENTIRKRKEYKTKAMVYLASVMICFVYSIYACSSGTEIKNVNQNKVVISDNIRYNDKLEKQQTYLSQVLYGPIKLDKRNSLYEIKVAVNLAQCPLRLEEQTYSMMLIKKERLDKFLASGKRLSGLNATYTELESFSFGGVFWDEEGHDSDGYWHESDTAGTAEFVLDDDAGDYYIYAEFMNKKFRPIRTGRYSAGNADLRDPVIITIYKGLKSNMYFIIIMFVFLILLVINKIKSKSYNELPFDMADA